MKKLGCLIAILILAGTAVLASVPAAAQEGGASIAVVDVQRLLRDSLAGQAIERQMQQFRTSFGEQIAQKEAALREKERSLVDQASILAPEVLAENRRKFEEEVVALQREVRDQQLGVEQSYAEAIEKVRQSVLTILQELVEERGIDVVLSRAAYLVASRDLDLTDEILVKLNAALPTITLNLPSGG